MDLVIKLLINPKITHSSSSNIFHFRKKRRTKLYSYILSSDKDLKLKQSPKMDQENLPPHVIIFPLPLQGPVNSMFKLAELLCLSGFHITFIVTEYIYKRLIQFTNIQSRFDQYEGFQIKTISDGLPEDHPHSGDQFMQLFDALRAKTKPLFKEMLTCGDLRHVTCIIADGIMGFTCDVANDVGIPIVYVRTVSSCCLWVFFCLPKLIESGELPFHDDDFDKLVKSVPGTEDFLRCNLDS
ncbi:hypothetical protein Leryth_020015 [Lithospermum erythrorhizon]|nr:hypothetical protein Leryth_020015 [Lithospermum erythrorhizon]